ncbi:uncharacterized protein [Musca autumnalis]|uniref:uncharacterized protein n=1 Tax=Musca autumnalis TaxID=221902 RepID=UPI003CE9D816
MSENFSIKTEPFVNDDKQENCNNVTNTPRYNTTKLENFTNMGNAFKEDEIDLDEMEEFLPENVDKSTIDTIKEEDVDEMDEFLSDDSTSKEDVDEMDEFLSEDSPNNDSPSSSTCKSDDRTEIITHDKVNQQHLTSTTTQQVSLPKLEIIDIHIDENDSEGPEINCDTDANVNDNEERSIGSSSRVAQTSSDHQCELCGRCYEKSQTLQVHLRNKHPSSTDYICAICNQGFTRQRGLERHSLMMHPEAQKPTKHKHKCEICGSRYTEYRALMAHIRNKHPSSIDAEYICKVCNQRFTTARGLDLHFRWMHQRAQPTQIPTEHNCEPCDSYMKSKNLQEHIKNKHPLSIDTDYICEICNQRFTTKTELERHSYRKHPRHICETCGSCFKADKFLRRHIKDQHTGGYVCEKCHKRFITQIGLETHSKMMHAGARKPTEHTCDVCGSCYMKYHALRMHIRRKHPSSTDLQYICEICYRRFATQTGLDRHCDLTHPVATKYKCEICGSCYKVSKTLRRHIRMKHPSSTDAEYICEICNQRFTTQRCLDKHSYWKHP